MNAFFVIYRKNNIIKRKNMVKLTEKCIKESGG